MTFVQRSIAVALAACGCRSGESPPSAAQPTLEVHAPAALAPAPEREPEPTRAEPMPVAADVVPLELYPVIRSRSPLQLFDTADGTHFAVANVEAIRLPAVGPIAREQRFLAGLVAPGAPPTVSWRASVFGGRWPHALYMVVEVEGGERWLTPQVYRFAEAGWEQIDNTAPPLAWSWVGVSPWRDRESLALRTWAPIVAPAEDERGSAAGHAQIRDALAAKAPRAFELASGAAASTPELQGHSIAAFDSLASGDVIAVSGAQTLHWSPGESAPRSVPLATPPNGAKLEMFAADDAYLLDARGLRHFDGASWTTIAVPDDAGVDALARTGNGSLWMVTAGATRKLLERTAGADWHERPLPDLAFPGDAIAHADYFALTGSGDYVPAPIDRERAARELQLVAVDVAAAGDALWIVARELHSDTDEHWALLHTVARGAVLELPDLETMRRELLDLGPDEPFAGQIDCEVFVPIAVPRVAGPHHDVQRRLAGVELPEGATMLLLEVERRGKRALGVVLPSGVETDGSLLAALRKALGKRMRTPICRDTIPRRQIARFP
ncbi:MAG TPA: hypothetical protein VFG69_01930 [Nannocystaceae bacterium]|nr:hypothetical protein [Nannocystaceae bacterium]